MARSGELGKSDTSRALYPCPYGLEISSRAWSVGGGCKSRYMRGFYERN